LLGLAAIATQLGNGDEATRRYLKVLELDPRNALAQAGLIGILGRADPQAAETRVKQLMSREPSAAFLHFALGITYIDQKRWPDAQQAFFQAHYLQPDNPDYAFNLAIALEHIGQPKAALDYYRRALQLATVRGRANFSTVTAEERIGKLEKSVR
jgi:tetratricopeptide (TPR) repeat protein